MDSGKTVSSEDDEVLCGVWCHECNERQALDKVGMLSYFFLH